MNLDGRRLATFVIASSAVLCLATAALGRPVESRVSEFVVDAAKGSSQGWSVALSADGRTALVGGPWAHEDDGAVWVFVRRGSGWARQAELVADCGSKSSRGYFGWSVSLSGDGGTALIGCPGPAWTGAKGTAWVFVRTGGSWSERERLAPDDESGLGRFGSSVALSADGRTAVIGGEDDAGGPSAARGAAWVFTTVGERWRQEGTKLTGVGEIGKGSFGASVALAANGETAIVGAPSDDGDKGAVWFYRRTSAGWGRGEKIAIAGGRSSVGLGDAVALDGIGDTAVVGSENSDHNTGSAWLVRRRGDEWVRAGVELRGIDATRGTGFGDAIALSANGGTVLVGCARNTGGAWLFTNSGKTWTQHRLRSSGATNQSDFGGSVALSGSGATQLVGAPFDKQSLGSAWVFGA